MFLLVLIGEEIGELHGNGFELLPLNLVYLPQIILRSKINDFRSNSPLSAIRCPIDRRIRRIWSLKEAGRSSIYMILISVVHTIVVFELAFYRVLFV